MPMSDPWMDRTVALHWSSGRPQLGQIMAEMASTEHTYFQ
jgi:hypothetical protein